MKISTKLLSILLSVLMLAGSCLCALTVSAEETPVDGVYADRISNPYAQPGDADGLTEGGDRENSYAWCMAELDGCIYIGTARNIGGALINRYGKSFPSGLSLDTLWTMIDAITNGDIPRSDSDEGGSIIRLDPSTGEFSIVYTADEGEYFCSAVTYGDCVYFGSHSAASSDSQYILRMDSEGSFTKIFETTGSVSLRANCVYDDGESEHLYFAGADDRIDAGGDKPNALMAVLCKSNDDDEVWDRVADYRDFGEIAYDPVMGSDKGAPIWELASHTGYIYATASSSEGFVMFRGRPAQGEETANEYGWIWEETVGLNNGINNPGLSELEGGEPNTTRSFLGSVYEFNGELYVCNFDNAFAGEAEAFFGMTGAISGEDIMVSDYLGVIYDSLSNPQKIWKLNDETGEFEELTAFTEMVSDTANEYVWSMGEYNGALYVSTMDAGVFYDYITQLTNGSFFKMSSQERMQKLEYLGNAIKALAQTKGSELLDDLRSKLEIFKLLIENIDYDQAVDMAKLLALSKLAELKESISTYVEMIKSYLSSSEIIDSLVSKIMPYIGGLVPVGASLDGLPIDMSSIVDFISGIIPAEYMQAIAAKISQLSQMFDPEAIKASVSALVRNYAERALDMITEKVESVYDAVDWDGIEMYMYINNIVKNSEPGFDLYRTTDGGESFEPVTTDGFGDKYNYGCSAFLAAEQGLYIGTCNPFYGAQLYLLTDESSGYDPYPEGPYPIDPPVWYMVGDADTDLEISVLDATYIQRYLAGIITEEYIDLKAAAFVEDEVTILDATYIQRYLASLDAPYPIGEMIHRETGEHAESIEPTELADIKGIKITANSLSRDFVPYLEVTVENNSDCDVDIRFVPTLVNGFRLDPDFSLETEDGGVSTPVLNFPAGASGDYRLEFNSGVIEEPHMSIVALIEMTACIRDSESEQIIATQKAVIHTSAYGRFDYTYDESGEIILDEGGVKLVYKGLDEFEDPYFYISNQSDKDIVVRLDSFTINGDPVDASSGSMLYSCSKDYGKVMFFETTAPGDVIEMTLSVCEYDEDGNDETVLYTCAPFAITL